MPERENGKNKWNSEVKQRNGKWEGRVERETPGADGATRVSGEEAKPFYQLERAGTLVAAAKLRSKSEGKEDP